jgi:hypothetical protein
MTQPEIDKFTSGYNEGVLYGVQLATSEILRVLNAHTSWMLPADRTKANAAIRMSAERVLQKRGLIPTTYQVLMGKAEKVELDFDMH